MSETHTSETGVYIIALRDDEEKLENLKIEEKLEEAGFHCDFQYNADPGSRPISDLGEQLKKYDKILLIVPKQGSPWIKFCQAVLADKTPVIPLIIHEDTKIETLDPDLKRLMCLKVTDKDYLDKLIKCLNKDNEDCDYGLPVAPIAPGLCANFFYGFLDIVLPDYWERLNAWKKKHGMANDVRVVQQMVIITLQSCKCKEDLREYAPEYIRYPDENAEKSIVEFARGQIDPERSYDQHMYEVTNPEDESEKYLVVLVLCSTMQTLYEMSQDTSCHLRPEDMQEEHERFEKRLQKLLNEHNQCKGKVDMLPFNDENQETNLASEIVKKCHGIMGQN